MIHSEFVYLALNEIPGRVNAFYHYQTGPRVPRCTKYGWFKAEGNLTIMLGIGHEGLEITRDAKNTRKRRHRSSVYELVQPNRAIIVLHVGLHGF